MPQASLATSVANSTSSWTVDYCVEGGTPHTKQQLSPSADLPRVKITRRYHPLQGQELEVISDGPLEVTVRHPDTLAMRIPRNWTDADGVANAPLPSDTELNTASLRDLLHLVEILERRM